MLGTCQQMEDINQGHTNQCWLAYYHDLITHHGQAGAGLYLHQNNFKNDGVQPKLIGVHAGSDEQKGFATIFSPQLFFNFILPKIQHLIQKFGDEAKLKDYDHFKE